MLVSRRGSLGVGQTSLSLPGLICSELFDIEDGLPLPLRLPWLLLERLAMVVLLGIVESLGVRRRAVGGNPAPPRGLPWPPVSSVAGTMRAARDRRGRDCGAL
jgi:hypothetical protein